MIRSTIAIAAAAFATHACGQNLLTNPNFLDSTGGWSTDSRLAWTNSVNRDGDPGGVDGAFQVTDVAGTAEQCVPVSPGHRYIVGASVINAPVTMMGQCPAAWQITVELRDGRCSSSDTALIDRLRIGPDDRENVDWFDEQQLITIPEGTAQALFTLSAGCATSSGVARVFFDNAIFTPDEIAKRDFEVHAAEGGPGSD